MNVPAQVIRKPDIHCLKRGTQSPCARSSILILGPMARPYQLPLPIPPPELLHQRFDSCLSRGVAYERPLGCDVILLFTRIGIKKVDDPISNSKALDPSKRMEPFRALAG